MKDIVGIDQYRLGGQLPGQPISGFKEVKPQAIQPGRRTFVTDKLPQPDNPAVEQITQLTYIDGQLAEITQSFYASGTLTPQSIRKRLEADIRREYSPTLRLQTRTLQLNDAQGDLLAVLPLQDPQSNPAAESVTVTVSRPSLLD